MRSNSALALLGLMVVILAVVVSGIMPGSSVSAASSAGSSGHTHGEHLADLDPATVDWKAKDLDYWRSVLSEQQVQVCRQAGTERPFTGEYHNDKSAGVYACSSCGLPLYSSKTKFNSGTGWPSFWEPVSADAVVEHSDLSFGMVRTEVRCARCDAHLGHVFDDGPPPTGRRHCINSVCLLKQPTPARK